MDDKQLVNQFLKHKSESAFKRLYESQTPSLYQMALRLTAHDEVLSQDLVQEMWCLAIRKLNKFEWRSELKTWLTGILINLSRNKRKHEERKMEIQNDIQRDSVNSVEQTVFTTYDLENAIKELPPGYRQIIILHDIEGYKHREVAELMDINEGTSKSQLYHARRALRERLEDKTENKQKS